MRETRQSVCERKSEKIKKIKCMRIYILQLRKASDRNDEKIKKISLSELILQIRQKIKIKPKLKCYRK